MHLISNFKPKTYIFFLQYNIFCILYQGLLTEATVHRQAVEKMAEQQQNKYLGLYTILPSELSLQLAEVGLALVNIHEQVRLAPCIS